MSNAVNCGGDSLLWGRGNAKAGRRPRLFAPGVVNRMGTAAGSDGLQNGMELFSLYPSQPVTDRGDLWIVPGN